MSHDLQLRLGVAFAAARDQIGEIGGAHRANQFFADVKAIVDGVATGESMESIEPRLAAYLSAAMHVSGGSRVLTPGTAVLGISGGAAPSVSQSKIVEATMTSTASAHSYMTGEVVSARPHRDPQAMWQFWASLIIPSLLAGLMGSPWWDRYVKGVTPEAQEADRQRLASLIASRMIEEYKAMSERRGAWSDRTIAKPAALRLTPRAAARVIGVVEAGTVVHVLQIDGAFAQVEFDGPAGELQVGWVFMRYLIRK